MKKGRTLYFVCFKIRSEGIAKNQHLPKIKILKKIKTNINLKENLKLINY